MRTAASQTAASREMRYCADIGMWALDRSPLLSCVHATSFCREHCFNNKLYCVYKSMNGKDVRNEAAWNTLDGQDLARGLERKEKGSKSRFRLMTRGEAFSTLEDVHKVAALLAAMPDVLFWIPTRGWRNHEIREAIQTEVMTLPNARVLASTDPSNEGWELDILAANGWHTMFFGDDNATQGYFLCPKTHSHSKGACASCKGGCFDAVYGQEPIHIHLLQH